MDQTHVKPPGKRRRLLIVAIGLAILLVSLCSWWYWPRGDARFVGKWDVSGNLWEFRTNGIAITRGTTSGATFYSTWHVEDDVLKIGCPGVSGPAWQKRAIDLWNWTIPTHQWLIGGVELRLADAKPQRMECVPADLEKNPSVPYSKYAWVFTRLPE